MIRGGRPRAPAGQIDTIAAPQGFGQSASGIYVPAFQPVTAPLGASPGQLGALSWWVGSSLAASPVSSWSDSGTKGTAMAQGVGANQPSWVASYAALGNKPAVFFDSTAKVLQGGAVGDYVAAHSGAGVTLCLVADLTVAGAVNAIMTSQIGLGLAQVGFTLYLNASNQLVFATGNGTIQVINAVSSVLASGPRVVVVRYSSATRTSGTRAEIRIGRAVNGTSGEAGAPSSANASLALAMGFNTLTCVSRVPDVSVFARDMSDTDVARFEAYALATYGV